MKKLAALAVIPLFAGFLFAQTEQSTQTETTTTTTEGSNWEGTLVDAGCYTTHSEHRESNATNPDGSTTTTRTETKETTCPVTSTTTTFGLVTPEGKYMRFDEPSNTRVVEIVKNHKDWVREMKENKPVKVHVIGKPNGDVVVVESIR